MSSKIPPGKQKSLTKLLSVDAACYRGEESEHENISKCNKRRSKKLILIVWVAVVCLWAVVRMYLQMCVRLWQWQGSSRESFCSVSSNSRMVFAAGPCRRWHCWGLPGWLREVTLLQRSKTQLQGRASDPSTRLHPPTSSTRKRGGGGDSFIRGCLTLPNRANRRERTKETTIILCHAA